jgi:uncharacterized protein YaiE (UPF0345 family)
MALLGKNPILVSNKIIKYSQLTYVDKKTESITFVSCLIGGAVIGLLLKFAGVFGVIISLAIGAGMIYFLINPTYRVIVGVKNDESFNINAANSEEMNTIHDEIKSKIAQSKLDDYVELLDEFENLNN